MIHLLLREALWGPFCDTPSVYLVPTPGEQQSQSVACVIAAMTFLVYFADLFQSELGLGGHQWDLLH